MSIPKSVIKEESMLMRGKEGALSLLEHLSPKGSSTPLIDYLNIRKRLQIRTIIMNIQDIDEDNLLEDQDLMKRLDSAECLKHKMWLNKNLNHLIKDWSEDLNIKLTCELALKGDAKISTAIKHLQTARKRYYSYMSGKVEPVKNKFEAELVGLEDKLNQKDKELSARTVQTAKNRIAELLPIVAIHKNEFIRIKSKIDCLDEMIKCFEIITILDKEIEKYS